ncbi:hypothetical protein HN784_02935 [bacterium]|jgi:hypothetical protein|nr:hypothetical protein [bacterium]MBT7038185.1 hypothetical protein [bacterium]MBT7431770.1 hypothetical protein [bacterium]
MTPNAPSNSPQEQSKNFIDKIIADGNLSSAEAQKAVNEFYRIKKGTADDAWTLANEVLKDNSLGDKFGVDMNSMNDLSRKNFKTPSKTK